LANFHSFVYQNKAMISFVPAFPHEVMKEGRECEECHDTQIIKNMKNNKFYPVTFENGELKNVNLIRVGPSYLLYIQRDGLFRGPF